jgi:hypothetical protein
MDNGNDRCYATPGGCGAMNPPPPPPFTHTAIFKLDETAMQAILAWQYPFERVLILRRQRREAHQRRYRDLRLQTRAHRARFSLPPTSRTRMEVKHGPSGSETVW